MRGLRGIPRHPGIGTGSPRAVGQWREIIGVAGACRTSQGYPANPDLWLQSAGHGTHPSRCQNPQWMGWGGFLSKAMWMESFCSSSERSGKGVWGGGRAFGERPAHPPPSDRRAQHPEGEGAPLLRGAPRGLDGPLGPRRLGRQPAPQRLPPELPPLRPGPRHPPHSLSFAITRTRSATNSARSGLMYKSIPRPLRWVSV